VLEDFSHSGTNGDLLLRQPVSVALKIRQQPMWFWNAHYIVSPQRIQRTADLGWWDSVLAQQHHRQHLKKTSFHKKWLSTKT